MAVSVDVAAVAAVAAAASAAVDLWMWDLWMMLLVHFVIMIDTVAVPIDIMKK